MSVRNGIALLVALSTIALLVGCGNNGNSITPAVPPPSGSFGNSNLSGTYVFSISGTDFNGDSYAMVGAFTANGQSIGGITAGGTVDVVDPAIGASVFALPISSGSYSVGVDGRGQATINTTGDTPFGVNSLTFDFVLADSSHGLITEFDGNASGSGTLDLQTAGVTQSSLTGSYAFSFSGANSDGGSFTTVGDFTFGSGSSISGLEDFNSDSIAYPDLTLTGQVVLGPSASPATELTTGASLGSVGTFTFDVYAIDATHLKFIEADSLGTLSGDAYSQPSIAFPNGTLAFTLAGFLPASSFSPFSAGGFMVTNGGGGIVAGSTEDFNENGAVLSNESPISFSASYTTAGSGRYVLDDFQGFTGGTEYVAYPSSGGLLLLEIDSAGGITAGAAYLQSTTTFGATLQGYGLNLTGINVGGQVTGSLEEVDDIAEFTASAASSGDGTLTNGIIDENFDPGGTEFGAPFYDVGLTSGTYSSVSTGRYLLFADAGNGGISTLNGGFNLIFYTVDGTSFPFMEMDNGQVATGVFVLQNPFAVTPGVAKSHMFVVRPLVRPHAALRKKK